MWFSDFSSYLSMHVWEQCKLCSPGTGQKPDSDQFPLQKLWSSVDPKNEVTSIEKYCVTLRLLEQGSET